MSNKPQPVDLFDHWETLPKKIQKIIASMDDDYRTLEKTLKALKSHGYTFDYYLDAIPYNLRKI